MLFAQSMKGAMRKLTEDWTLRRGQWDSRCWSAFGANSRVLMQFCTQHTPFANTIHTEFIYLWRVDRLRVLRDILTACPTL